MSRRYKRRKKKSVKWYLLFIIMVGIIYLYDTYILEDTYSITDSDMISYSIDAIPDYNGEDYVIVNSNEPFFKEEDINTDSFEKYGDLDKLGRCTYAYANIGKDLMPTKERESIGIIKPSGWHTVRYDIIEDGKYLYNRCHLIGYQLTGENANEKNLITCTRYMNATVMVRFENMVADYIKKTNNHVLYRVTPFFEGDNLLAKGVLIEALSVEDNGEGIKLNVFVYNIQKGIIIDYSNGDSYPE